MERWQVRNRAQGALLGAVVGDVLGVPYSYSATPPRERTLDMSGGGVHGLRPGHWTATTDMALVVGLVASDPAHKCTLMSTAHLDDIARVWFEWHRMGHEPSVLIGRVLQCAAEFALDENIVVPRGIHLQRAAAQCYSQSYRADCNGSLARAHVVAVATLSQNVDSAVAIGRQVHTLTHVDRDADEAVVLWTLMVRQACLKGTVEPRDWLSYVPEERRDLWLDRIEEAEQRPPSTFGQDDWVVHAFQSAWSAVYHSVLRGVFTAAEQSAAFNYAMHSSVSFATDTDVVAAITGGLAGALFGVDAINPRWLRAVHGWPSWTSSEVLALADCLVMEPEVCSSTSLLVARLRA